MKYRKLSLKKEMTKLREVIPNGKSLDEDKVIDETISLIETMEDELLTRLRSGLIPKCLKKHLSHDAELNISSVKSVVLRFMNNH